MTRIIGTGAMALALFFVLLTYASGQDKIAADLETARAGFAKQLEDAQKKFLAAIDAEIAKAAKSGSLETVKSLQQEKLAIEANFEHDSKVTRLRPTIARYRAEINAAKDKLKVSLSNAVAAYTKELKIAQAESVDTELKSLNETRKQPTTVKTAVSRTAADVNVNDLKNGVVVSLFNRLPTQRDNEGFVDPSKLGTPAADPTVTESIENWSYDSEKNAVAFSYLKIESPGEYEFRTYNFYDRNALFVSGQNVCPYRGSVAGGSEPAGKESVALQKGYVSLVCVGYVDARGSVAVTWKPPGQKDFSPIPKDLLFYDSSKVKAK